MQGFLQYAWKQIEIHVDILKMIFCETVRHYFAICILKMHILTELHTTQWLGGVLDRLWAICPNSSAGWPKIDPTSVLSSRRWANVSPTYNAVWLVRLCRGLPMRVPHTTEPARYRAAGLCAVRWCAARSCVIRLGCVEGQTCQSTKSLNSCPKTLPCQAVLNEHYIMHNLDAYIPIPSQNKCVWQYRTLKYA